MPEAGFEPTITASERAKAVHALDRSPTVTSRIDAPRYSVLSMRGVRTGTIKLAVSLVLLY
jgi:hypothetical protein